MIFPVSTLGFRGEALATIAEVSRSRFAAARLTADSGS